MWFLRRLLSERRPWCVLLSCFSWFLCPAAEPEGVFVRFRLLEPAGTPYYVKLGGYIHKPNWYLPGAVFPANADRDPAQRVTAGQATGWFDVKAWAGKDLHGRLARSGGIAEFPNVTVALITDQDSPTRRVVIELATAADEKSIVKQFDEACQGNSTSFLVSPYLAADKDGLETLSQMMDRQLAWARAATGGQRVAPKRLILQTSFWSASLKGAEVLSLLGFNVVGNQTPEVHAKFPELLHPGHTHDVDFGPGATRDGIDALMKGHAARNKELTTPGVPFGFSDEICARPEIGQTPKALEFFRAWLAQRQVTPAELGVAQLAEVVPIENPTELGKRQQVNRAAANRVFYYTCRFRQESGTERIKWTTESFHRYFAPGLLTTALVADHPYFSGTGLGMGMVPNWTWYGAPLALDWFDLARSHAVDLAGIEDWMGLQYMYGPPSTWEGFQLMGFQAGIFRSGSRGTLPVIAWITPSDETNLRLKCSSALAQGAKHFFFWTYGPTAFSTENYWSDLRGEYDGIAKISRQLAAAEHIIAPGTVRRTKVALLYSISSDIWQPYGYIHILERRGTWFALTHDQYLVDMLTEQDVEAGRLKEYDVLYTSDPCLTTRAAAAIEQWVEGGGSLYGTCGAGSRNEFNEEVPGLARVFGIQPQIKAHVQEGEYRKRCSLNYLDYTDEITMAATGLVDEEQCFGVVGVKAAFTPSTAIVIGAFKDQTPAAVANALRKGRAIYFGGCPGLAYIKDAKFVPRELKEQWPPAQRRLINALAARRGVARLVDLDQAVVEAGLYDAPAGTALILGNFTYQPIEKLTVRVPLAKAVKTVRSVEQGNLDFVMAEAPPNQRAAGYPVTAVFSTKLGLNDVILLE